MQDDIWGAWTLRSFHMEEIESGQRSEPFGPSPRGSLLLHPDGRMAALIAPRERSANLQSFVAYAGRFRLEPPDRIVTTVDVSWFEEWIGTDQVRTYALDGDRLALSTPPGRRPRPGGGEVSVRGLMSWARDGSNTDEEPPRPSS